MFGRTLCARTHLNQNMVWVWNRRSILLDMPKKSASAIARQAKAAAARAVQLGNVPKPERRSKRRRSLGFGNSAKQARAAVLATEPAVISKRALAEYATAVKNSEFINKASTLVSEIAELVPADKQSAVFKAGGAIVALSARGAGMDARSANEVGAHVGGFNTYKTIERAISSVGKVEGDKPLLPTFISRRGKHCSRFSFLFHNKELQERAMVYMDTFYAVHKKEMKWFDFHRWLNTHGLTCWDEVRRVRVRYGSVSLSAAKRFGKWLGYKATKLQKGLYVDAHEDPVNIAHRSKLLEHVMSLWPRMRMLSFYSKYMLMALEEARETRERGELVEPIIDVPGGARASGGGGGAVANAPEPGDAADTDDESDDGEGDLMEDFIAADEVAVAREAAGEPRADDDVFDIQYFEPEDVLEVDGDVEDDTNGLVLSVDERQELFGDADCPALPLAGGGTGVDDSPVDAIVPLTQPVYVLHGLPTHAAAGDIRQLMLYRARLAEQRAATEQSAALREAESNVFTTPDRGGGRKQVFIWIQDESVAKGYFDNACWRRASSPASVA